jgi:hypothetical protein
MSNATLVDLLENNRSVEFDHPTIVKLAKHIERKLMTYVRRPDAVDSLPNRAELQPVEPSL